MNVKENKKDTANHPPVIKLMLSIMESFDMKTLSDKETKTYNDILVLVDKGEYDNALALYHTIGVLPFHN